MKSLIIILIIAAVVELGGIGFLFAQYQSLTAKNTALQIKLENKEKAFTDLKDEKTKIETELAVLKSTDLAKEAELLQLKLKNTEKELATAQNSITNLQNKNTALDANLRKITPYLDAISAIEQALNAPFTAASLANIDTKINALKDSQITSRWSQGKSTIDISQQSWMPTDVFNTIFLISSRIRNLLP